MLGLFYSYSLPGGYNNWHSSKVGWDGFRTFMADVGDADLSKFDTGGGDLVGSDKILGDKAGDDKIAASEVEGDIVSGDKIVQYLQIDLPRLLSALRQGLPENDPAPAHLVRALRQFKIYHARLNDYKDLHNQLNDILFNYGSFSREIERLAVSHEDPEPRAIGIHWRPIFQRVTLLLDWASAPRTIIEAEPFARLEDRIVGPPWAVELCAASDRLDELVRSNRPERLFVLPRDSRPVRSSYVDIGDLYDAASEFFDVAERTMYLVDRQLRETTAELLSLSRIVLGSLED